MSQKQIQLPLRPAHQLTAIRILLMMQQAPVRRGSQQSIFQSFFLLLLQVSGKPVNFYKHLTCAYISCLIEFPTRVQCFNIFLASILCMSGHIVHCVFLFVSSVAKFFPCLFVQEQVMDFTGLFGFFMHLQHTAGFHKVYD